MVFQNYALYPHMTVRDNMSFALALAKKPKAEIAAQVARAADILGLAQLLDRYPRQLSGGQRQRVAMGRAIVRDPQVFLFDEPLVQPRRQAARADAHRDQGAAPAPEDDVDLRHARPDRGDDDGRQASSSCATASSSSRARRSSSTTSRSNTFVAGFIGSPAMNLLAGTAARRAAHVEFAGGASLPLPPNARADDGQPVLYGIRPEHCAPASQGLPVEVVVVEPTGADTQLYCKLDGKEFTAVVRDRTSVHPGERVMLQPDLASDPSVRRVHGAAACRVTQRIRSQRFTRRRTMSEQSS